MESEDACNELTFIKEIKLTTRTKLISFDLIQFKSF